MSDSGDPIGLDPEEPPTPGLLPSLPATLRTSSRPISTAPKTYLDELSDAPIWPVRPTNHQVYARADGELLISSAVPQLRFEIVKLNRELKLALEDKGRTEERHKKIYKKLEEQRTKALRLRKECDEEVWRAEALERERFETAERCQMEVEDIRARLLDSYPMIPAVETPRIVTNAEPDDDPDSTEQTAEILRLQAENFRLAQQVAFLARQVRTIAAASPAPVLETKEEEEELPAAEPPPAPEFVIGPLTQVQPDTDPDDALPSIRGVARPDPLKRALSAPRKKPASAGRKARGTHSVFGKIKGLEQQRRLPHLPKALGRIAAPSINVPEKPIPLLSKTRDRLPPLAPSGSHSIYRRLPHA
eukprot:TRINITY_DN3320_c0_g1_i1.p1 TRINITY_DN3320_c0_g1~~TRINITY_DN3320_c0_g1_i1.p1  ORF type:complete len:381 (+),score=44.10 TRINITY_DN3320_c0_g1_i1:63-1145(+)